ncbi:MAG: hypothetical protein IJ192_07730 [Clostridia bacterium]|nr:hypothetical protein [Clostridia bacterium]MBR2175395.1 hypothetical protein [Clostridia bacterium]
MSTKEMIFEEVSKLTEDDAEKLYALIRLLFTKKNETLTDSQKAFQELESLKKKFSPPVDDDKEEYIRYLEEKYENLG